MYQKIKQLRAILLGTIVLSTVFFGTHVEAALDAKNIFVAQDISCTTAEMDGMLVGTYTEPLTVIYQIGTTKELIAPVSLRTVTSGVELSATLSGLRAGYTYSYHFKDGAEFGAPFGYGSFLFKPTVAGCGGQTGGTTSSTLVISNLDYAPTDDVSFLFTGEITHGLYDAKTFAISVQKLVTNGTGPEEEPITKVATITKQGAVGENDTFEVVVSNLQPGSYNYSFYDKGHTFITGSSGFFGIDELPVGANTVSITDVAPGVTSVVITGTFKGEKQQAYIHYGTSPSKLDLLVDTKTTDADSDFTFETTGFIADTTYYFQVFDSKNNPLSQAGSFSTLASASPSPDMGDGGGGQGYGTGAGGSYAPDKRDMLYSPGIIAYSHVYNQSQTSVTISGEVVNFKKDVEIYLYQVDGPTYTNFAPRIDTKTRRFEEKITNLMPNHLYMLYIGNPINDLNVYSRIAYFETLPIRVDPGASIVAGDNATIVAKASDGVSALEIEYGTDSDNLETAVGMNKNSDGTWSAKLEDLTPDTTYYYDIKITSTDIDAQPTYSYLFQFITGKTADDAGTIPYIIGPSNGGTIGTFEPEDNGGIIPCTGVNVAGTRTTCTFEHLIKLINNIINFLMFALAPGLAALMFLYGGFLMLTSAGNAEKISQAKTIFMKVITGLIIAFAAWIIVKMVMVGMGYNVSYFPTFF